MEFLRRVSEKKESLKKTEKKTFCGGTNRVEQYLHICVSASANRGELNNTVFGVADSEGSVTSRSPPQLNHDDRKWSTSFFQVQIFTRIGASFGLVRSQ